ncbi:hypothetical protein HDU97_005937 [Phlyctochytrium planicorne]|nr:hypothetical protein HDU97_005937 [Phlyctochytrium planicorne]
MATTAANSTNWKNVNNWHWVEKNCFPWANDYLKEKLVGVKAEDNGIKVEVTKLASISGDVDINQRKGKLITVYDVAFKLDWKGKKLVEGCGTRIDFGVFFAGTDSTGAEASGQIDFPEMMHDTDPDELVFEVTADKGDKKDEFIQVVKKKLLVPIRKNLSNFSKDMVEANSKDVHIPSDKMNGHPVNDTYKPKPPAPTTAAKSHVSNVVGGVTSVKMDIEFKCDRQRLFECFTKEDQVKYWSRNNAKISAAAGSEFELFGGNITGKIVEFVPPTKVIQQWRLRSWPAGHFSTVTVTFEELSDSTVLHLVQSNVPVGEKDTLLDNWNNYYWDAIKRSYGFGAVSLNIV